MANIFTFKNVEGSSLRTKKLNWLVGMVANSQGPQGLTGATGPQGPAGLDGVEGVESTLQAWESQAWQMTSDSYATEPEDVLVKVYTSNGDGTFSQVNTTEYSAFHWERKADALKTIAGEHATSSANSATEANEAVASIGGSVAQASGYADNAQTSADIALENSQAVNFVAGMIVQWHSDKKPTGWLWCDGGTYTVFSPSSTSSYEELYQVLVDSTYIMTTKPIDWDATYPSDPNGWYDPANPNSVVTQAELDLVVTVPDYRGTFLRAKDQAGTTNPARGIDSNGVVDLSTITWSQNKSHIHELSTNYLGTRVNDGPTDDNNSVGPDAMTTVTVLPEGGDEAHPTYQTTNYIIRTKGVYNGDGTGSGGSSLTPIASEIEVIDTYNNGVNNLQETTDGLYFGQVLGKDDVGARDATYEDKYSIATSNIVTSLIVLDARYIVFSIYSGAARYYLLDTSDSSVVTISTGGNVNYNNFSYDYDTNILYLPNEDTGEIKAWDWNGTSLIQRTSFNTTLFLGNNSINVIPIAVDRVVVFRTGSTGVEVIDTVNDTRVAYTLDAIKGMWGISGRVVFCDQATSTYKEFNVNNGTLGTGFIPSIIPIYDFSSDSWNNEIDTDGSLTIKSGVNWYTVKIDLDLLSSTHELIPENTIPAVAYLDKNTVASQVHRFGILARGWAVTSSETRITKFDKDPFARVYAFYNKEQGVSGAGKNAFSFQTRDPSSNSGAHEDNSVAFGYGTKTGRASQIAVGEFNVGRTDTLLEVGIGISDIARANGLEVYTTGDVQAPNRLAVPNPFSLLTKDIADGLYTSGVTGTFTTADGKTATVTNGLITALI